MALVIKDGSLLKQDDALASGQACCCGGGGGGCCCVNGAPDTSKTTQEDCETAGGTWNEGEPCASAINDCRCCEEYKFVCAEEVIEVNAGSFPCPDITVSGELAYRDESGILHCAEMTKGGEFDGDTCYYAYTRYRIVSDCSECQGTVLDCQRLGPNLVLAGITGLNDFFCECASGAGAVNVCETNPLP